MSEEKHQRDFKGIWIPKEIWLEEELSIIEKIMLVEINSLDNERGCYAGNEYFANFFGITTVRVSQIIKRLKDLGYVTQESFDGRQRIIKTSFKIYFKAELNGSIKQPNNFVDGSIKENDKHNNTFSNTLNNPINNTKKGYVSVFNQLYIAAEFGLSSKLVQEWDKVDWTGIDSDLVIDLLSFFKYRTEAGKPIKTARGANLNLNNVKGYPVDQVRKLIKKCIEREWQELKFYDADKKQQKADKWKTGFENIK